MIFYFSMTFFGWIIFSSAYYLDAKVRGDIDYFSAREKMDRLTVEFRDSSKAIGRIRRFSPEQLMQFSVENGAEENILTETDLFFLRFIIFFHHFFNFSLEIWTKAPAENSTGSSTILITNDLFVLSMCIPSEQHFCSFSKQKLQSGMESEL